MKAPGAGVLANPRVLNVIPNLLRTLASSAATIQGQSMTKYLEDLNSGFHISNNIIPNLLCTLASSAATIQGQPVSNHLLTFTILTLGEELQQGTAC